jgi:tetraacyldisaccharide-1-P 4'-kinase
VFRAQLRAESWVNVRTGESVPAANLPFRRPAAFCGLGNPQSFRRTLERLGAFPVTWFEFEDHHRYFPNQLRRIAHQSTVCGADALVTTEKDSINLCDGATDLVAPLPIYWLKVVMRVQNETAFLSEIVRRMS